MANVNEVVAAHSSVAAGASMSIQPSGSEQWMVMNIYVPVGTTYEVYRSDGTNDIKIQAAATDGGIALFKFLVTNGIFIKVKNTSASAVYIGYDGIRMV